jgi:hypothetical protein
MLVGMNNGSEADAVGEVKTPALVAKGDDRLHLLPHCGLNENGDRPSKLVVSRDSWSVSREAFIEPRHPLLKSLRELATLPDRKYVLDRAVEPSSKRTHGLPDRLLKHDAAVGLRKPEWHQSNLYLHVLVDYFVWVMAVTPPLGLRRCSAIVSRTNAAHETRLPRRSVSMELRATSDLSICSGNLMEAVTMWARAILGLRAGDTR